MIKQGKLNQYSEKIGKESDSTWTAERVTEALALAENAHLVFCPWTNDMEMLSTLDAKVFSRRPDITLFISRQWDRDLAFGYQKSGAAIPGFFEELCQIMIDQLSEMKHVRKLKVHIAKLPSIDVLGKLSGLRELDIDCDGKNSIAFLEKFTDLEKLELHGCFQNISAISACKKLKSLLLQGNEAAGKLNKFVATDLSFIREMNLEFLQINIAKLSGEIVLCQSLKTFILANNNIDDISFLSSCPTLSELLLHRINVAQLDSLAELKNLKVLSLECCKALDIATFPAITSLEYLQLADCKTVNVSQALNVVKALPKLKKIKSDSSIKLFKLGEQLKKAGLERLVPSPSGEELPELFEEFTYLNLY